MNHGHFVAPAADLRNMAGGLADHLQLRLGGRGGILGLQGVAVNSSSKPYEDVVIKTITIQGPEFPEPDHYPAN